MIGMFGLIGKTLYKYKNTANCFKDGEEMAAVFFSCSHLDMETQTVLLNMSKEEFLLMMRCDISQGLLFMKAFFCSVFDGRQTEQGPPFPVSQGSQRKKIQPCGSFVFMCCQVILLVLQQGSGCMVPPFMTKTLRRYFPLLWRPPEKHPKHPSSWAYLKRKLAWTYHSSSRYYEQLRKYFSKRRNTDPRPVVPYQEMEHLQRELTCVCRGTEQKVIGPFLPILSDLFLNITKLLLAKYLSWYIHELPHKVTFLFRKPVSVSKMWLNPKYSFYFK